MKNLYHVCLTAHNEVLLRDEEDARQMLNYSAIAAYRSNSQLLTDSEMSTHTHDTIASDHPNEYVYKFSDSFTKVFNTRHGRKGPLFDKNPLMLELRGSYHTQMALTYALRQGMHHGITSTPFEYQWSSCNSLFMAERGITAPKASLTSKHEIRTLFPKGTDIPEGWQADEKGMLIRSSFEELTLVETWFGTPRSFLTSMNRKTSEEWLEEQKKDNVEDRIITLDLLEKGYSSNDISEMLRNEGNPKYVRRGPTDMQICKLIDNNLIGRFHATSVYELDIKQKIQLLDELRFDYHYTNVPQLSRCLAIKY